MAEAEDVITDVARHATAFAQDLWRRHRPATKGRPPLHLADVCRRLDLLITAVFGRSFPMRVAQPPSPPTWLAGLFRDRGHPVQRDAVPATDGCSIWLPATLGTEASASEAMGLLRTMALQQALRAMRDSARHYACTESLLVRELYLLLEARAAENALLPLLPGMAASLDTLRARALERRPPLTAFGPAYRPLEELVRWVLGTRGIGGPLPAHAGFDVADLALPATSRQVLGQAIRLARLFPALERTSQRGVHLLWRDAWTGDLRAPPATSAVGGAEGVAADSHSAPSTRPRNARLPRRPDVREALDDEDDGQPGAWMVQPSPPLEQAEDPMGLQRPTDRDSTTAAEEFADALSELPEARLVSAPGTPKEVLLSDEPVDAKRTTALPARRSDPGQAIQYPEWDWCADAYRVPGATVLLLPAPSGAQQWVDQTLERRRGMLDEIRRRFESLRARRVRLHRQLDGDEIDLPAYIESQADFRAGLPLAERVYQQERRGRRDMAIMLLVDVSGSTDGWIAPERRVIDVEREALLLVCIALNGLAAPYSVLSFSGEGQDAVVVRCVKSFREPYNDTVKQRIAGLEPEQYTRAGAAIRHASTVLIQEPAEHRLLLMLSDGKPNDVDAYEGRYGVEDTRQAVIEAKLQGVSPFCLTIDRQPSAYLGRVFGPNHYALLPRPELLPLVLLDWLRRLVLA